MEIILRIAISLAIGSFITLLTKVPLLSALIGLGALPIVSLKQFNSTGKHVEYGFAWIILKSPLSKVLFVSYYTVVTFLIITLVKG